MVLHWLEGIYQVCNQRGMTYEQEATSASTLEMVSIIIRLLIFEKAGNQSCIFGILHGIWICD